MLRNMEKSTNSSTFLKLKSDEFIWVELIESSIMLEKVISVHIPHNYSNTNSPSNGTTR